MSQANIIIGVIGSRKFTDYDYLEIRVINVLDSITQRLNYQDLNPNYSFVSGGAKGADSMAEYLCKEYGYPIKVFLPKFKREGLQYHAAYKKHYYERDVEIAEACNVLTGFLLKGEENRGSMLTINHALKTQKEVHVFFK